ncbi:SPFH domain-containing protein [Streptomyces sp. NBC_01244]|uniref:SPFH domain-containing protein n=1 Tax=Streptomyces sp. NBC_01244 TaxID=2903797 RepID=UPI002E12025E|nr:SPFH domain-containing protein [Streptomyces sp. NBC_01244]
MYPTRTTSTTGTFEIPPHPTPRATPPPPSTPTPTEAERPAAPQPEAAPGTAALGAATPGAAGPGAVTPGGTTPGEAAPAVAAPRWAVPAEAAPTEARWAAAGSGTEPGPTVPTAAVPAAARWAPAEPGAERNAPLSGEPDLAAAAPAAARWAAAEAGAEPGAPLSVAPDLAAPVPAAAGPGTEPGSYLSAAAVPDAIAHDLAAPVPAAAWWAAAEPGVERGVPLSGAPDVAAPAQDAAGRAAAGAGTESGSRLSASPDRAASVPAAAGWVPARVGAERAGGAPDVAALVPVPSGRAEVSVARASDAVTAAPPVPAAAVTEWAASTGWALAGEPSGSARGEAASRPAAAGVEPDSQGLVAVGAAAQATAVAPHGPAGRAGEGARSDVPAARAQAEPGLDIPHPQDEATHAGAATIRLRNPDTETARPHPQDGAETWPPTAVPAPGAPLAAAEHAPRHAGPPAAWDLPGQGGSAAEHGRGAQHAVPGPAPEDLPEPGDAAPADRAGGPEPARSVPAPGGAGDTDGEAVTDGAAEATEAAIGGGVVPGPGAAEVVEVVARAVARIAEDDTQDLPLVTAVRGVAVTEVPVHLPFRGAVQPQQPDPQQPDPQQPGPQQMQMQMQKPPQPKAQTAVTPRSAPGRRVPRGDDRLHEHHGPVLPGWIAVAVGGVALAGCAVVLWRAGAVPDSLALAFGVEPRPYRGLQARFWPPLAFLGVVALLALGGLGRGRAGHAWVLTLFGRYRGTVRRTGLTWISPLLLRRRVDVRLRHWRSDPMPAVDSGGLALQVVVQVVWQVKDTARATLAVEDHVDYLAEQVESAMARVLSQLPADAFHEAAPTLRDAEAVGDALTRMLAAETEAVGVEVFSAQPTRIEYAPEVADAMRRRRVAAIDAKHRDTVLTSVVDAVDDTVHRLTSRGIVELDDYERKALVKDLTVAFYTGRAE